MPNAFSDDQTCDRSIGLCKVVDDWINPNTRSRIESIYGLIQNWDTTDVTKMDFLFNDKTTFNADLSKWNVAKVTSMKRSTCHFPLFNSFFLF